MLDVDIAGAVRAIIHLDPLFVQKNLLFTIRAGGHHVYGQAPPR